MKTTGKRYKRWAEKSGTGAESSTAGVEAERRRRHAFNSL